MQGSIKLTANMILKFSVLIEILPYWGYPHKWRVFCMKINKKSQQVWRFNRKAFYKRGDKIKRNLRYNYKITELMITGIIDSYKLFNKLTFKWSLNKSFMNITKRLTNDMVVVFHPPNNMDERIISISKSKLDVLKQYDEYIAKDKPKFRLISKSDISQMNEIITYHTENHFVIVKRLKHLVHLDIMKLKKNTLK